MAETVFIDLPPEPKAIHEIFVWIGVHADGREAMLSADMPMAFGTRHTPLMSSRRELAEEMQTLARRIQREAMHRSDRLIRIELRTFVAGSGDG
ncbi:MAG: hypothetical protein ABSC06_39145 [Rhodopila sp.]|jgi:hypothetical protein